MHQQQHKNKISLPKGDNTQHNPERAICQATVIMQLPNGDTRETVITTDPCNSASMAKRALLHDIKTCNHYNQQPIRMTTVTGPSPWYKEMGILRFRDGANKKVSVLCYVHEKEIPGHPDFVLLSNSTLVDMEFDSNYQMKASKEIGPVPLKRMSTKDFHWYHHGMKTKKGTPFMETASQKVPKKPPPWEPKLQNFYSYSAMDRIIKAKKKRNHDYDRCNCSPRIANSLPLTEYALLTSQRFQKNTVMSLASMLNEKTPAGASQSHWDGIETRLPMWEPVEQINHAMSPEVLEAMGEARCFMTEIQLQALLDRTAATEETDASNMDMTTDQNGDRVSKFDIRAIKIGKDVSDSIKKLFKQYNLDYIGKDSVYPTENGAPRILTQFKDAPYSLELQDQYTTGPKPKKIPSIKGIFYQGKPATNKVLEHFVRATPVVERCDDPRCISRLVIVPKIDPGMPKNSPPTSYRVTMNAIINDCLKPVASTLPLATDEIKKLHGFKYFIKADAMHAYWSIPLDDESKKLLCFQTHEGVFAWNRLTMGCRPSSQVQQTAFHNAMDKHLPPKYRHRIALFADDMAAGANSMEELFEIYKALIQALHLAGIQLKASKVEFGRTECTFHNYTVVGGDGPLAGTTTPKTENLDPIANSSIPQTVTQLKAFLGATQQLANYVPQYSIAAAPLHRLTRKGIVFPSGEKWIHGTDYDIAYHMVKAMMTDTPLYLWNKVPGKHLFIEVDSCNEGWGAVIYQHAKTAPTGEEPGRHFLFSKEPKRVVQWISKAWSDWDKHLPCFYKESLARLLALEHFRNLIETQAPGIGVTCYSDHLPAVKESSLSNKGALSTWRIHEVADLNSMVETIWKKGATLSTADPLSRLARREHRLNNLDLPLLMDVLLKRLPDSIRHARNIRVNAEKDTPVATRITQKWRTPTNPIINTRGDAPGKYDFLIMLTFADKVTNKVADLIRKDIQFAALVPVSLLNEIDRKPDGKIDLTVQKARLLMQVIVIASIGQAWLINHKERRLPQSQHFILLTEQLEEPEMVPLINAKLDDWIKTLPTSSVKGLQSTHPNKQENYHSLLMNAFDCFMKDGVSTYHTPRELRALKRNSNSSMKEGQNGPPNKKIKFSHLDKTAKTAKNGQLNKTAKTAKNGHSNKRTKTTPPKEVPSGSSSVEPRFRPTAARKKRQKCIKNQEREMFSFASTPKPSPIEDWVGHQTEEIPKNGRLLEVNEKPIHYPPNLIMVMDDKGRKLIVVPLSEQLSLTRQAHMTLIHQKGQRVFHDLAQKYFWTNMEVDIINTCKTCKECLANQVQRKRLTAEFVQATEDNMPMPRMAYGIDFYGHNDGEILVALDLCTREVLLWFLPSRKQDLVAKSLLSGLIFQKGVPLLFRNDEASEFVHGVVNAMNGYLGIDTITTGGHNPRSNSTVERFMQTLNGALRKCNKSEYKDIKHYLQAIAFAHNTTFHSSINCTPFECGHGLRARSITDARMSPRLQIVDEEGTELQEVLPQWDTSIHKKVLELAERLKDDAVRHSQWQKRMTAEKLNMAGKKIDDNLYDIGTEVYYFKPPTQAQVRDAGKMNKHLAFYHGPAKIIKKLRTRQYVIEHNGSSYKRDVEMLIPVPQLPEKYREFDPTETKVALIKPTKHKNNLDINEGEMLIMLDTEKNEWFLAEVTQKYQHKVVVNYYSTPAQPLENYDQSSTIERKERLAQAHFRKTWFVHSGKNSGRGTLQAPFPKDPSLRVWEGFIPKSEYDEVFLIRNAHLTAAGKLSKETLELASQLQYKHNATLTIQDTNPESEASVPRDPDNQSLFNSINRGNYEAPDSTYIESITQEQRNQSLFNYSQAPLCNCARCTRDLAKAPKEPILDEGSLPCGCLLCCSKTLAS